MSLLVRIHKLDDFEHAIETKSMEIENTFKKCKRNVLYVVFFQARYLRKNKMIVIPLLSQKGRMKF